MYNSARDLHKGLPDHTAADEDALLSRQQDMHGSLRLQEQASNDFLHVLQVRDYVVQLEAHLAEVHRQAQRLIERQSKMGSSMSDFGASMVALGKFESGTLAQKFTKLGERSDSLSGACQVSCNSTID